jgi:ABC-type multidrug transport system fused ATPase/permease subunit
LTVGSSPDRRILDLLAVDPTIMDGPGALPSPVRGAVRFDGVRFAYGGAAAGGDGDAGADGRLPARLVLDGFDLVVPRGETHAIVGSTGAGCPTATTRWSASAARSCRAGNASGCRSRGRSSRILPVLVLDEATSAVDNETEAAIQRSLELVGRDRTVVVIAHRLSTVRHADRIHVLEEGRIVESGSHDELVARRGLYAALWRIQTGEVHALPSLPSAADAPARAASR